jgi:ATP diphosphatase
MSFSSEVSPPAEARANDGIARLLAIMARLRDPETGCDWDVAQTFATIAPYTIEEAYEVADAIARDDMAALREELGDLLLQVVFHARMAEELGSFDFDAVAHAISDKMTERHPHIFGDASDQGQSRETRWEAQKAAEREAKGATSALDGVALALPALMRAEKLQKRAARVGFDWPDAKGPREKIDEELRELEAAAARGDRDAIRDELGDVLFSVCNLARHLGVDPETALRGTVDKFAARFHFVEQDLGADLAKRSLDELEASWQRAKVRLAPPDGAGPAR